MSGQQEVKYMMTHGTFKFTEMPSKHLTAVELPYKNERYSLLIVMPDSVDDLKQFSKESNFNSLNEITAKLEQSEIQLFVPKFRFECTSRAEKALGKVRRSIRQDSICLLTNICFVYLAWVDYTFHLKS